MKINNIDDYLTTDEFPIGFELTDCGDTSFHTHSFIEIFYVICGEIKHVFKKDCNDTKTEILTEGDMMILMRKDAHRHIQKDNIYCAHRDIVIREDFFIKVCDFLDPTLYDKFCNYNMPNKVSLSLEIINEYERSVSEIMQTATTSFAQKAPIIKAFTISLLSHFLTLKSKQFFYNFPTWFTSLLDRFNKIQYLQMGIKTIIEPYNYDYKYLCHVFKKYVGMTMTDYLNLIRLKHSIGLIQNSSQTISEIANSLGFSSVSYFNVIFKRKYGITPKELRKKKGTITIKPY